MMNLCSNILIDMMYMMISLYNYHMEFDMPNMMFQIGNMLLYMQNMNMWLFLYKFDILLDMFNILNLKLSNIHLNIVSKYLCWYM